MPTNVLDVKPQQQQLFIEFKWTILLIDNTLISNYQAVTLDLILLITQSGIVQDK